MKLGPFFPACELLSDGDDAVVRVFASAVDLDTGQVGRCVRASLQPLCGHWAHELHQYLANSGNSLLLYRIALNGTDEAMPIQWGSMEGHFGHGVLMGTEVSSAGRIQLGVSVLTSFALSVSQGADPCAITPQSLGRRIRELGLPVA